MSAECRMQVRKRHALCFCPCLTHSVKCVRFCRGNAVALSQSALSHSCLLLSHSLFHFPLLCCCHVLGTANVRNKTKCRKTICCLLLLTVGRQERRERERGNQAEIGAQQTGMRVESGHSRQRAKRSRRRQREEQRSCDR